MQDMMRKLSVKKKIDEFKNEDFKESFKGRQMNQNGDNNANLANDDVNDEKQEDGWKLMIVATRKRTII